MKVRVRFESLPITVDRLSLWMSWLSEAELNKCESYRFVEDQNRFIGRRGLAREAIAEFCHCSSALVQFVSQPNGKLIALRDSQDVNASVSIAKSKEWVAACVGLPLSLGIDVEMEQPLEELNLLAREYLSSHELQYWQLLPCAEQVRAYYQYWVVKEAAMKATGMGLNMHPASITVMPPCSSREDGSDADAQWKPMAIGDVRVAQARSCLEGHYELFRLPSLSNGPITWGAMVCLGD